jgi:hypothetical protein
LSSQPTPHQRELSENALALKTTNQRKRPQGGASKRHAPPQLDFDDRFLSREEAAHYLGMVVSALEHDAVRQHLGIPFYKFGQLTKYRRSELDEWAAERRRGGQK